MGFDQKKIRVSAREFREILSELEYFQNEYARLTDISEDRIHQYASGERVVSGTDSILIRMMSALLSNPTLLNEITVQKLAQMCSEKTIDEIKETLKK